MTPDQLLDTIGDYYDSHAELAHAVLGTRAMHKGYFTGSADPATYAEAADRLTRTAGRRLRLGPDHALLDIGSGAGQPAVLLAEETGCSVTGVDATPGQVAAARRLAAGAAAPGRISFETGDARRLPLPADAFHRALMMEVVSHLPDTAAEGKAAAFAEAARCLRPGGLLAVVDMVLPPDEASGTEAGPSGTEAGSTGTEAEPTGREAEPWMDDVPSVHLSTRSRLLELLRAAGFEILEVEDLDRYTCHSGPRTRREFDSRRPGLTDAYGHDAVERVAPVLEQVARADEHLGYVLVTARARPRPSGGRRRRPVPRDLGRGEPAS
ncbi:methyltransferase domain-containing protein [Streptomyces sp. NPDC033538]|uniref:SAM-dependent methyltransferase n=1 Tax=Streptomyces sp. NPDC033538 TaxID=3155367 RepID=UPI003411E96B